jgi:hypothetical protein
MPSILFWNCDCGVEWRAFLEISDKKQICVCFCNRRRELRGTAVELDYSKHGGLQMAVDWIKAPKSSLIEPE